MNGRRWHLYTNTHTHFLSPFSLSCTHTLTHTHSLLSRSLAHILTHTYALSHIHSDTHTYLHTMQHGGEELVNAVDEWKETALIHKYPHIISFSLPHTHSHALTHTHTYICIHM